MNVRILSEIGENTFVMSEDGVLQLLSTAMRLQKGNTAEEPDIVEQKNAAEQEDVEIPQGLPRKIERKSRVDSMFGNAWKKETQTQEIQSKAKTGVLRNEGGYKGFLIVKCRNCGKLKGFCAKYPMKTYKCEQCGDETELKEMRRAFVNCKCGASYKYLTNVAAEMFSFDCLSCGGPVDLVLNDKKDVYQSM